MDSAELEEERRLCYVALLELKELHLSMLEEDYYMVKYK